MITESKSEVVISMYANAKIPEPFCRRAEKPQPAKEPPGTEAVGQNNPHDGQKKPFAVSAAETGTSTEQKKTANSQPDNLPLLTFLLMEFFR